jgi:hypothetical protein
MPVKLTIDNKSTDHFSITAVFDLDALEKVSPCTVSGIADPDGDALIAFMFKEWCDHKASDWFTTLAKSAVRVELAEDAVTLSGQVIGPSPQ